MRFSFPDYDTVVGKAILGNLKGEWVSTQPDTICGEVVADKYLNALVLQSLMLTNRMERGTALRNAAARGHLVLDRYDASAIVYGTLDGLDPEWLELTNAQLPLRPDLYILLDIPVGESFTRRPERRDRYEKDRSFLEKVREGYLRLFAERQEKRAAWLRDGSDQKQARWNVIDGTGSIEDVSAQIFQICAEAGIC